MGESVHQQRCRAGTSGVAINQATGRGLQASAAQGLLLAKVADALRQQQAIGERDAHSSTSRSAAGEAI